MNDYVKCTELSVEEWGDVLINPHMTRSKDLEILRALYWFANHQATASELGARVNGKKEGSDNRAQASPMNTWVRHYARRIKKHTNIVDFHFTLRSSGKNAGKEQYWDFFFEGWDEKKGFVWKMKPNLVQAFALLENHQIDAVFAEEVTESVFYEGAGQKVVVNRYERDKKAREACIEYWQAKCSVCDFRFVDMYGELGKDFIHVHHIMPLSEISESYQVNPKEHLRPVCPNCHAMLHKRKPPYGIEELREIIIKNRK